MFFTFCDLESIFISLLNLSIGRMADTHMMSQPKKNMRIKKKIGMLLAVVMAFSMMPFSAVADTMEPYAAPLSTTTAMRPFPQAGQDTGMMVELFNPGTAGQNAANMAILHQFARLVSPDEHPTLSWSNTLHPSTLFATHGTNSLFVVDPDPATRNDPNAFRMVMFLDAGTGGASVSQHSYRVTVCEAMGYGMLMLVKLAGSEDINLGPEFGNRTMRQLLLEGLPAGLRSQFSASPNAPNAVTFQTYFDAMFRSLRHFPSFPRSIANGYSTYEAEHIDVTDVSYRAANTPLPAGFRASYQMAWSIHHMPGQSRFQRETYDGIDGTPVSGPSTATDGTMDMAYALILANEQWGHAPVWCPTTSTGRVYSYLEWARRMVGDIWEGTVHHSRHLGVGPGVVTNPGYFLKIGNWANSNGGWNNSGHLTRPSDHMIQHMRAFAAVDPGNDWQRVIDVTHDTHRLVRQNANVPGRAAGAMPNTGILPDFLRWNVSYTGTSGNQWIIPRQGASAPPWSQRTDGERFHEFLVDGAMHQNASRVPWRLGVDVLFAGTRPYEDITTRALNNWLAPSPQGQNNAGGLWINQFGGNPSHGVQGRWLDGTATANTVWDYTSTHFRGPMLVPAAIYGPQDWFNTGWAAAIDPSVIRPAAMFNYYGDYINILSMIAASGNEWTPVGNSVTVNGGTTANGFNYVRRVVAGARVPLHAADPNNFSMWEIEGTDFWPGYGPNTPSTFIVMPVGRDVVARTGDAGDTYAVNIQNSHAGVSGQGRYVAGNTVTIRAGERPGYRFVSWTVDAGNVQLANPESATTTFVMPSGAVAVTANWERSEIIPTPTPDPINPRNRAVGFANIAVTSSAQINAGHGWYASFSPGGPETFVEFDVTTPGYHTLRFVLWGADGLPAGYLFDMWLHDSAIRFFHPLNPTSTPLPVTLASMSINGVERISNRAFTPYSWWYNYIPMAQRSQGLNFAGFNLPHGRTSNHTLRSQNIEVRQFPLGVGAMDSNGNPLFQRLDQWSSAAPSPTLGTYTRGDEIAITFRVGDIPAAGPAPSGNFGDINDDGVINAADLTWLRRYMDAADRAAFAEANGLNRVNMDVTGSGQVNEASVSRLRDYLAATNPSSVNLGPTGGTGGLNTWPAPPSRPAMRTFPEGQRLIALTFDDGPNSIYTVQILNHLRDLNATATFYVNPNKFNDSTIEVIHRMIAEGHDVDHHGWDHTSFGSNLSTGAHSVATARSDMERSAQHIFDATGYWPWSFRAPFFEWGHVRNLDAQFNMAFHGANIDTRDYMNQNPGGRTAIANSVINASPAQRDGAIVLFHDCGGTRPETVAAVPLIINALQARGYEFVTVRELHYHYRNTPGRAGGGVGHMNVGPNGITRNGIGSATTGTPLWPQSPGWWTLWGTPNCPWTNPVPPWQR